jgi:hypothetical protein
VPPGDGVAVCTLTDTGLADRLRDLSGVAVAAPLRTANIGIEQIVRAVLARPSLRALLVCGADSRLFRPGQSLIALLRHGIDGDGGRIRRAEGYDARLPGLGVAQVERFRNQLTWHDARGVDDEGELAARVAALRAAVHRAPAPPAGPVPEPVGTAEPTELRPRGRRRDLSTALQGFVVITADHAEGAVLLRVFDADLTPRYRMRGRRAESMVLGLLEAGVITDPAHTGYLGTELGKAETALRCGLRYEQDLPLRPARHDSYERTIA